MAIADQPNIFQDSRETQWPELRRRIGRTAKRRNLDLLWPERLSEGKPSETGVLLWGLAAAKGPVSSATQIVARIAVGQSYQPLLRSLSLDDFDLATEMERFLDRLSGDPLEASILAEAIVWAYAMPRLGLDYVSSSDERADAGQLGKSSSAHTISEDLWWSFLGELQTVHRSALDSLETDCPERLMAAGELGAVLAWHLVDLPSCAALADNSLAAITHWFEAEGDAVVAAVDDGGWKVRLVLASAMRCRRIAARMKKRLTVKRSAAAVDLATWATIMMRGDGSMIFSPFGNAQEDHRPGGLFAMAIKDLGGLSLQSAVDATMGRIKSEGKLAWQVQLPESAWFDDTAGLAAMLPEWDVKRGRLAVHYRTTDRKMRCEISGGKHLLVSGILDARIWKNDAQIHPTDAWNELCWYTDDDVHYLELEQTFEANVKIQRQIMMLRSDRCLMVADAVIGETNDKLKFESEIPLASNIHVEEERETRELTLVDGKRRALLMPLGMSEWKVGPSAGSMRIVEQEGSKKTGEPESEETTGALHLVAESRGTTALYSPLWIDFDRKRLRQPRTWRQLTIGEKLKLVPASQAAAFRVHAGMDQWVLYRSLDGQHNRTFMGKNLISDFFCGRFDAEDGSIEELVSVDEQPD